MFKTRQIIFLRVKQKFLFICVTLANDEICIIVYMMLFGTLGYPMSIMAHVSFKEPGVVRRAYAVV